MFTSFHVLYCIYVYKYIISLLFRYVNDIFKKYIAVLHVD